MAKAKKTESTPDKSDRADRKSQELLSKLDRRAQDKRLGELAEEGAAFLEELHRQGEKIADVEFNPTRDKAKQRRLANPELSGPEHHQQSSASRDESQEDH